MKQPLDKHTRALLTCMWAGLALTAILILLNHDLSAAGSFVIGVYLAWWMGRLSRDRPWSDWRRALADKVERALLDVKQEGEKLMDSSSIARFNGRERVAAEEKVLIAVLGKLAPERRVPQ